MPRRIKQHETRVRDADWLVAAPKRPRGKKRARQPVDPWRPKRPPKEESL